MCFWRLWDDVMFGRVSKTWIEEVVEVSAADERDEEDSPVTMFLF